MKRASELQTTAFEQDRLFLSLAEQLSQTFLQITRTTEIVRLIDKKAADVEWEKIRDVSEASMMLTEAYVMTQRLDRSMLSAELEPVTISAMLYDTAERLQPLAKRYGVELSFCDLPKLAPVLSDKLILQTALISLGQVLVIAESQNDDMKPIKLAAHRGRYGTVAGFYMENVDFTSETWRYALRQFGKIKQPLGKVTNGQITGALIADKLLKSLESKIHVARYQKLNGLAVTLPSCNQLQLV